MWNSYFKQAYLQDVIRFKVHVGAQSSPQVCWCEKISGPSDCPVSNFTDDIFDGMEAPGFPEAPPAPSQPAPDEKGKGGKAPLAKKADTRYSDVAAHPGKGGMAPLVTLAMTEGGSGYADSSEHGIDWKRQRLY